MISLFSTVESLTNLMVVHKQRERGKERNREP